MDSRTVALIRTTFKAVAAREDGEDGVQRLARTCYSILFAQQPELRDLFPAAMATQHDRFVKAIAFTIERMEKPGEILPFLAQLGRDHRKYGVLPEHYTAMCLALKAAIRLNADTEIWTDEVDHAWDLALAMISDTMVTAAEKEPTPPVWTGTVLAANDVLRNLTVVRLQLDAPMRYAAGQYVSVQVPTRPRMWRYLSPAVPANPEGVLEFHIRAVSGGWVSSGIVGHTNIGDKWLIGAPLGGLGMPRNPTRKLLMVGCGTGIAPLRAQLMAMTQRRANPQVHLFVGGKHPCDLYDMDIISKLAVANSWLSVTPVTEHDENPWWYTDPKPQENIWPGVSPRRTGAIGKIVAKTGTWADHDVQIVGSPSMVQTTKFRLMASGTQAKNIRHDPLA